MKNRKKNHISHRHNPVNLDRLARQEATPTALTNCRRRSRRPSAPGLIPVVPLHAHLAAHGHRRDEGDVRLNGNTHDRGWRQTKVSVHPSMACAEYSSLTLLFISAYTDFVLYFLA